MAPNAHNDLMYRLGDEDYLKSYDRAPPRRWSCCCPRPISSAMRSAARKRMEAYRAALALDPDNKIGRRRRGQQLEHDRAAHAEAQKLLDDLLARPWRMMPESADLRPRRPRLPRGDPRKAAALCERKRRAGAPRPGAALAILGTLPGACWATNATKLLNGYDSLIQIYRSRSARRLSRTWKASMPSSMPGWTGTSHHPRISRPIAAQRLARRPTGCSAAGHELVERLQLRIREAHRPLYRRA